LYTPQAEGKKILLLPRVLNRVLPEETSTLLSPLIINATGPDGKSFAFTPSNIPTNKKVTNKKTITLVITNVKSIYKL
jgi:hypothetical protein